MHVVCMINCYIPWMNRHEFSVRSICVNCCKLYWQCKRAYAYVCTMLWLPWDCNTTMANVIVILIWIAHFTHFTHTLTHIHKFTYKFRHHPYKVVMVVICTENDHLHMIKRFAKIVYMLIALLKWKNVDEEDEKKSVLPREKKMHSPKRKNSDFFLHSMRTR